MASKNPMLRAIGRMVQDTTRAAKKRAASGGGDFLDRIRAAEQRTGQFMRDDYGGPEPGTNRTADSLDYRGNMLESEANASFERDMRGGRPDNGMGRRLQKEAEGSYKRSERIRGLLGFRRKIT